MSVAESSKAGTIRNTTPLRNGVTIFAAHFHVRNGNEIFWAKGAHTCDDLSKRGIEWKVLPSGSHLLEHDILYFDLQEESTGGVEGENETIGESIQSHSNHLIGVAAFKNRKIDHTERGNAAGVGDDDQRGARMISVGIIVNCGKEKTPWTILSSILPHICQLEKLADAVAADPGCHGILEEWLEVHQHNAKLPTTPFRDLTAEGPFHQHDPLLALPAISNALGPLFPRVLKTLLQSPFGLLIYTPHGGRSWQAASIAFILAELTQAAYQTQDDDQSLETGANKKTVKEERSGIDLIGVLGLHDISALENRSKTKSWIGWTSDRLLLEKPNLYDAILDLSPISPSQDSNLVDSTALPRFSQSKIIINKDGRKTTTLNKQVWTTREFAIYRGIDERASFDASSMRHSRRALGRKRSHSSMMIPSESSQLTTTRKLISTIRPSPSKPSTSTMLAFITFWLSSLRILPLKWRINLRESYGYVPLSIRSDGGVRASIMLLPSDDDEDDEMEEDENEDSRSSNGVNGAKSSSLGVPSLSPTLKRRSLDGADEEELNREAYLEDPILAAVGAGSVASRRRHSRSLASKNSMSHLGNETISSIGGVEGGSSLSPDQSFNRSNTNLMNDTVEERQNLRDAREAVRLAVCLFVSWSEWIDELIESVQDLVHEKLMEQSVIDERNGESDQSMNGDEEGNDTVGSSEAPLNARKESKTSNNLKFKSKDFTSVGLSSNNDIDVDLMCFIANKITDLNVEVVRSWSLFSWLC